MIAYLIFVRSIQITIPDQETMPNFQFHMITLLCDWLGVENTRTVNVVRTVVRHLKALGTLFKLVIHKLPLYPFFHCQCGNTCSILYIQPSHCTKAKTKTSK